jgi:hypothetical protein
MRLGKTFDEYDQIKVYWYIALNLSTFAKNLKNLKCCQYQIYRYNLENESYSMR